MLWNLTVIYRGILKINYKQKDINDVSVTVGHRKQTLVFGISGDWN